MRRRTASGVWRSRKLRNRAPRITKPNSFCYTLTGDTASAKKAYEVLPNDLWKDADVDLPQLVAAKKEYAALK